MKSGRMASVVRATVAVVMALLALGGPVGPRAVAQVDGDRYVNPDYGYELSWDGSVWAPVEGELGDLTLESDLVRIVFQSGQFYDGDAAACRDDLVGRLPSSEGIDAVAPYEGIDDAELTTDGQAWATLEVDLAESDSVDARTVIERIECRTLVAGEAVLAMTWLAPIADADAALAEVDALLDALLIPSFGSGAALPEGLAEDGYVDPDGRFSLAWDPAVWTPFSPVDALFGLDSSVSLLTFDVPGEFGGDADSCVGATAGELTSADSASGVEEIDFDAGDDSRWVGRAFRIDYGGTERFVEVRCAVVADDAVFRVAHSGPYDALEDERAVAAPVFASLSTASSGGTSVPVDVPVATPGAETADATPLAADPEGTPPSVDATPAATSEPLAEPVTFEAADGGWSVTYDASTWTPLDPAIYQTVELALNGPTTVATFSTLETDVAPSDLLDELVATEAIDAASGETGATELETPAVGSIEGAVSVAVALGDQGPSAAARGFVIVPVQEGTVVVVRIFGTAGGFDADRQVLSTLIGGLTVQ